jgi:phage gp46-like protein
MTPEQPLSLVINGVDTPLGMGLRQPLPRAVIISLFTWGRARPDDELPGTERMGWWGDSYPAIPNDRIGSRLWLLARTKITVHTPKQAKEFADEALAWLIVDGVASQVIADAERGGMEQISLRTQIVRGNAPTLDMRFNNAWSFLNV